MRHMGRIAAQVNVLLQRSFRLFNNTNGDSLICRSRAIDRRQCANPQLDVHSDLDVWKLSYARSHVLDISNASSPSTGMAMPATIVGALRRGLL